MAKNKNGDTWLVWSSDNGRKYELYYAVIDDSNKVTGPLKIKTDTLTDSTPFIIFDDSDVAWIVWSGNSNTDDDIYYSKHNGTNWEQQKPVHENNEFPDIFPQLSLDENGSVRVDWNSMNKTGAIKHVAILQKGNNKATTTITRKLSFADIQSEITSCVTSLPENIDNLELATIQLNCEAKSKSIQFVGKVLKKK